MPKDPLDFAPPPPPPYWFPAKRYGWGWGFPATWQGWVVFAVWLLGVIVGASLIAPRSLPAYFAFMAGMVVVIVAVCYWKGEPPRWRWGDRDR
jgi:hypothetical protein